MANVHDLKPTEEQRLSMADQNFLSWLEMTSALPHAHIHAVFDGFKKKLVKYTYAIPWGQRKLVVLIIRKLMASSSYALIGTLKTIKQRLEDMAETGKEKPLNIRSAFVAENDLDSEYLEEEPDVEPVKPTAKGKPIDQKKLQFEIQQIDGFIALARSIKVESKARELLKALDVGFARMKQLGGQRKAQSFL